MDDLRTTRSGSDNARREVSRLAKVPLVELTRILEAQKENEHDMVPANTVEVCEFLCSRGVGFVVSRNSEAHSCREARDVRKRLGHTGIPLCDELKSLVGEILSVSGDSSLIAVHSRADCEINAAKLCQHLGVNGTFRLLEEGVLRARFGLEYGIVNPVLLELRTGAAPIAQVFDAGVSQLVGRIPGTMMTNAGHFRWAIEFEPLNLVDKLSNATFASIADPVLVERANESPQTINPRSIGIITGNGPDSGIALWEAINGRIVTTLGQHFMGDISLPRVVVVSIPEMGLSMELASRADVTWKALEGAAVTLCEAGVDLIAIACNTTQVFRERMDKLCAERGSHFVSLADVVVRRIRGMDVEEFAIVGIDTVAELGQWSAFAPLADLHVERLAPETLKEIHEIGYLVKQKKKLYPGFQQLRRIFNTQIRSQVIIVALTEISIILASQNDKTKGQVNKTIIDTLDLYAETIAQMALGIN